MIEHSVKTRAELRHFGTLSVINDAKAFLYIDQSDICLKSVSAAHHYTLRFLKIQRAMMEHIAEAEQNLDERITALCRLHSLPQVEPCDREKIELIQQRVSGLQCNLQILRREFVKLVDIFYGTLEQPS